MDEQGIRVEYASGTARVQWTSENRGIKRGAGGLKTRATRETAREMSATAKQNQKTTLCVGVEEQIGWKDTSYIEKSVEDTTRGAENKLLQIHGQNAQTVEIDIS